jgi:hypothetical protein
MFRIAARLICVVSLWAEASFDAQQTSLSPSTLAEAIDSGQAIDWAATWKALGRTEPPPPLPRCGDPNYSPCTTELISIPNPPQMILLLQTALPKIDYYLRFMGRGDSWHFAGYYAANLKYYPRGHGTLRFEGKPFLKISVQGEGGTGFASEMEEWFDLTLPSFKPVFEFPAQGDDDMLPGPRIDRAVYGSASEQTGTGRESIAFTLLVRFSFEGTALGEANFLGIYVRSPHGSSFELQSAYLYRDDDSPRQVPNGEFVAMTRMLEGPSTDKLVSYTLPGLRKIAAGRDSRLKSELRTLLQSCADSPEKTELQQILGRR